MTSPSTPRSARRPICHGRTRTLACALAACAALGGTVAAQHSAVFGGGPLYHQAATVMPQMRSSGFTTVILWTIHVYTNGDLYLNNVMVAANGQYVGLPSWPGQVQGLKAAPTSVDRIELSVGSAGVRDFENVEALINAQGTGPSSILYRNFAALRSAMPAIDAVDFDDESNYDVASTVAFSLMLQGLGFRITIVPYTATGFWASVFAQVNAARPGTVDRVYLQVYAGGSRNDPSAWNPLFPGVPVSPGLWCRHGSSCSSGDRPVDVERKLTAWARSPGVAGGFLWLLDDMLACQNRYPIPDYAAAVNRAVGAGAVTPFGSACGNGRIGHDGNAVAGASFRLDLTGGQPNAPCLAMLSSGSANLALDPWGMSGCFAHVDLVGASGFFLGLAGTTSGTGDFTLPIGIPLAAQGTIYAQYAFTETALNPVGLGTTRGLQVDLR